jgi:hypothetical protein
MALDSPADSGMNTQDSRTAPIGELLSLIFQAMVRIVISTKEGIMCISKAPILCPGLPAEKPSRAAQMKMPRYDVKIRIKSMNSFFPFNTIIPFEPVKVPG